MSCTLPFIAIIISTAPAPPPQNDVGTWLSGSYRDTISALLLMLFHRQDDAYDMEKAVAIVSELTGSKDSHFRGNVAMLLRYSGSWRIQNKATR